MNDLTTHVTCGLWPGRTAKNGGEPPTWGCDQHGPLEHRKLMLESQDQERLENAWALTPHHAGTNSENAVARPASKFLWHQDFCHEQSFQDQVVYNMASKLPSRVSKFRWWLFICVTCVPGTCTAQHASRWTEEWTGECIGGWHMDSQSV